MIYLLLALGFLTIAIFNIILCLKQISDHDNLAGYVDLLKKTSQLIKSVLEKN